MPWLKELQVDGFRNLRQVFLGDFTQFNQFVGDNGAGKSSLLEAIHVLGLGRSFRHLKTKPLVRHDGERFVVRGKVASESSSLVSQSIGVMKSRRAVDSMVTIQGKRCRSSAELAEIMPMQLIDSESFQLVVGSPSHRRQYLDWGVFHVEHVFLQEWKRCQRVLKQRNSLLRHGKIDLNQLDPWDSEFAALVSSISARRVVYLAGLEPLVREVLAQLYPDDLKLEIRYVCGWDDRERFEDALRQCRQKDIQQGYTQLGSHRADLKFTVGGHAASEVLSRGQLKLLAVSLKIAQARYLWQHSGRHCVFLVDDLSAELDARRRELVCQELRKLGCQVHLTCVDTSSLGFLQSYGQGELKVFHVEHGKVRTA